MPVEHFRSEEAYRKNLAYRHIHGIPFTAVEACVAGKCHKVKHSKNKARKRIDAVARKRESKRRRKAHSKKLVRKR